MGCCAAAMRSSLCAHRVDGFRSRIQTVRVGAGHPQGKILTSRASDPICAAAHMRIHRDPGVLLYTSSYQEWIRCGCSPQVTLQAPLPVAMLLHSVRLVWLALARSVLQTWAQVSTAQCVDEFKWMINSKGQNPCLVAAYLDVPCSGSTNAIVQPLQSPSMWYLGPLVQDDCACNTVRYSLVEACERCQFSSDNALHVLPWSGYSENCTSKSISGYPNAIPPGTAVPAWAFLDVVTDDVLNMTEAAEKAREDTTNAAPSSLQSLTSDTDPSASMHPSTVAALVGGIVGGVLGVLLICALVFYLVLRQRKVARAAYARASTGPPTAIITGMPGNGRALEELARKPTLGDIAASTNLQSPDTLPPSVIYNPDDPRTWPPGSPPFVSRAPSPSPTMAMSRQMLVRGESVSGDSSTITHPYHSVDTVSPRRHGSGPAYKRILEM
ncbi:hypothetical protein C8Q76DRAFT_398628 [Earliella scabrosa]|nr:hypothetical protein C8Q76DRAFT_398628 [Earliella scabrosa]